MSTIDPAVMKMGQEGYALCMGCHAPDGKGMPNVAPPLAGSEWVTGNVENLIKIQFRGLMGPIEVAGQEWNLVMPASAPMLGTDEKIAAVLTYIRNSWGNSASEVSVEEVSALRGEMGKPMLTVADLEIPVVEDSPPTADEKELDALANEVKEMIGEPALAPRALEDHPDGFSYGSLGFYAWTALCIIPVIYGVLKNRKG